VSEAAELALGVTEAACFESGLDGGCDPSTLRGVTRSERTGEAPTGAGGLSSGSAGEVDFL